MSAPAQAPAVPAAPAVPLPQDASASALKQALHQELGGEIALGQEVSRSRLTVAFAGTEAQGRQAVLVHVVPPEVARMEGGVVDRLLRAARAACALRHPRIVPVVRVAAGDRLAWYVERRVAGETLDALLEREYQLPVERVVSLVGQIAMALGGAHERGVMHGGLVPSSILVGSDGGVMVREFGIAHAGRSAGPGPADDPSRVGYLAPELDTGGMLAGTGPFSSGPASAAADQYALAVIAYQMLTGALPFMGETSDDVRREHRSAQVPPLTASRPDLPAALATVLERALAKHPGDRFASVTRFAASFRLAAQGRSSPSRGVTRRSNDTLFMPPARTLRPTAMRSGLAAAAATLVLILVAWKAKDAPWSSDTVNSRLVAPRPDSPAVTTAYGNAAPAVPAAPVEADRTQPPRGEESPEARRPEPRGQRPNTSDQRSAATDRAAGTPPTGAVTLGTNPYSTIYINGVAAPGNPVRNWTVPAGRVSLRFEVNGANGTMTVDTTITVDAGETTNLGFVRLGVQP